jgi:methylmalonyl-CoA mutase N-terminal domain/subunit
MDPEGQRRQVARLAALRKDRDNGATGQALDRLRLAAQGTENTMPFLLDAVCSYATLGEITNGLKEVFGVYEETVEI